MLWALKVQMKAGRSHIRVRHDPGSTSSWSGPRAALAPPTFWPFPASGFCPRAPPPPGRFSVSSAASFSPDCRDSWNVEAVISRIGRLWLWGHKSQISRGNLLPAITGSFVAGANDCMIPYAKKLFNDKQWLTCRFRKVC